MRKEELRSRTFLSGGGAYDPALSIESQFSSYYSEHAACPNIICSLNYYEDLQLDFNRIFKGELLKYYEEWCYGQYSIDKLTQLLGTDLREYFTRSEERRVGKECRS